MTYFKENDSNMENGGYCLVSVVNHVHEYYNKSLHLVDNLYGKIWYLLYDSHSIHLWFTHALFIIYLL